MPSNKDDRCAVESLAIMARYKSYKIKDAPNPILDSLCKIMGDIGHLRRASYDKGINTKKLTKKQIENEIKYSSLIEDEDDYSTHLDAHYFLLDNYNKSINPVVNTEIPLHLLEGASKVLLRNKITTGGFRQQDVYIGTNNKLAYKFPHHSEIENNLKDLQRYFYNAYKSNTITISNNNKEKVLIPTLIAPIIYHHRFEHIHPFLDGNGRIGRSLLSIQTNRTFSENIYNNREPYYKGLQLVQNNQYSLEAWATYYETMLEYMEDKI